MNRIVKLLIVIFSFILLQETYPQAQFTLEVKDFIWQNAKKENVELVILISLKNTGTEAAADEDVSQLYLACSNPVYKYGTDITFVKFNNDINQVIQPGEEKVGYLIYKVPRDANDLKLKFPDFLGGGEKLVCFSYLNYTSKDAEGFLEEARSFRDKADYTNSLINYLKAATVNPLLKISSEIDSVFNLFALTDNSSVYYELFSGILVEHKTTEKTLNPAEQKQVKIKGKLIFCREYRDGQAIGQSDKYSVGSNGGYLTIVLIFNREIDFETISVKVVYNGLLFDITRSESEYRVTQGVTKIYIPNIHFSTPGNYTVKVFHPNGRKIASGQVSMVEKK